MKNKKQKKSGSTDAESTRLEVSFTFFIEYKIAYPMPFPIFLSISIMHILDYSVPKTGVWVSCRL